ncbi:MAG: STAS domain-containing protein [candidate division WOR-3 bacterium]|nr:STAS domain-containing protein [candidate division WOR-3 bacterium]
MELRTRNRIGNATVMEVTGRLDAVTSPAFEKEIIAFFSNPAQGLALDLGQVDYISSAGLRVMLLGAKKAKESNGGLALFGLRSQVMEVFRISGLTSLLAILPNEAEALAAIERQTGT